VTRPWLALAAMLLVQMLVSLTLVAASVLAPAVAPTLGLAPERIGLYAAVAYLAAMLFGLRTGQWVARIGALRLSQVALLACTAGALLAGLGPAAGLLGAALLIGVGYGLVNPAAAAVLSHHAPTTARGLFFSIKQTGVPIGVALAGLLMPLGLATLGWRATAVALALACAALALALWPLVRRLEPPPAAAPEDGALRLLSLASLAYAMTQQTFVTFLVALLNLQLGWTLAAAAGVLAASQAVSTAARIGFGALADRWRAPARLLVGLGAGMSLACLGLAALTPAVPAPMVVAVALVCAATAMGWNGVFFAELANRVPREDMARVSGATQFFTFAGGMLGPLLFGESIRAGGSYALAYAALALVPAAAALTMWRALSDPRS
jgi:MFS family permease